MSDTFKKTIFRACVSAFCLLPSLTFGQAIANKFLKDDVAAIKAMGERLPIEKLYLQTDKPYYSSGDTVRFKAYLLDASFLLPSAQSGLLYVELDNMAGTAVKRVMVPVASGLAWGNIALDEKEAREGSFVLRAYTNWMRNFGEGYVFKKNIYVSATNGPATLVRAMFRADSAAGKNKVEASLQLASTGNVPVALQDFKLHVTDGRHVLARDKVTTGIDGGLKFGFGLADKTALKNLTIKAQQAGNGADTATLTVPVNINRPEKTDLQFMPEGGGLVAGIATTIGFKAVGEDGKGVALAGKIYNGKGQEITSFKTAHAGMGSFELTPQAGESYYAKITLPKGITKEYPLPLAGLSGTSLAVKPLGNDTLVLTVNATADLTNKPITYYLVGQSRGVVCYAQTLSFSNNLPVKEALPSSLFPTGIARFTLLDQGHRPLNERQVFIGHHDELKISVSTNKSSYTTRDSIALAIEVKDKDGHPVQGSFSLAVTDDGQVRTDSTGTNILNNLLLTSDLKGNIEGPGHYFEGGKAEELDNLMLTQGWVGYSWKEVFGPVKTPIAYPAEKEFVVQGRVGNFLNKPVAGADVVLFSIKTAIIRDTITNKDGHFVFKNLFPIDTATFNLQVRNKRGKSGSLNISVNEFIPPVFLLANERPAPWYVNSDTVLLKNTNTKIAQLKAMDNLLVGGHQLKEVTIRAKKIIPGSKNLNGPGGADYILDQKDMDKAGKRTLSELLLQRFPSFYKGPGGFKPNYYLFNHVVALIIDGVDIQSLQLHSSDYMDYLIAEDIKGIEIMSTVKYALAYDPDFIHKLNIFGERSTPIFLEITTYSGNGAFLRHTPSTYLYKTLPFALYKEFYRPKYNANNRNIAMGTDLRSTIHWEPNVTTDAEGKASLSFYSADKPASYTIIIEGTDLQGQIGYLRQKINVATAASSRK